MSSLPFELGDQLPVLAAGSICLRWLTEADLPALFEIFGDPEVTRYWGFGTLPDRPAAAELLRQIHAEFRQRTLFQWGLESAGQLVGTCTLARLDPINRRAELGFALGRAHQGRGYMSTALPVLLDFAFTQMQLHRIFADTDPRNAASIRLLDRLGFQREGLLREHYLVAGEPQDGLVFGLLRREWSSRR